MDSFEFNSGYYPCIDWDQIVLQAKDCNKCAFASSFQFHKFSSWVSLLSRSALAGHSFSNDGPFCPGQDLAHQSEYLQLGRVRLLEF